MLQIRGPAKDVKFKNIVSHSRFVPVNSAMRQFRIEVWPKIFKCDTSCITLNS